LGQSPHRRDPDRAATLAGRVEHHAPTKAYVARRLAEGKTKAEIIRCLKRLLAREIWAHTRPLRQARNDLAPAA